MKKSFALLSLLSVLFIVAAVHADFSDFRDYITTDTPENFEHNMPLSYMFPGSAITYTKGYQLEWKASNVLDYRISGGEISTVLQRGFMQLPYGACGGLIMPDKAKSFKVNGDLVLVSSDDTHYIYGIKDCAQYTYYSVMGYLSAISGNIVCEATLDERIIRETFTGNVLYEDQSASPTVGIFGGSDGCYYLQRDGNVYYFSQNNPYPEAWSYVEPIVHASVYENGFTGFTGNHYFILALEPASAVYIRYDELPGSGICLATDESTEPYCEGKFEKSFTETALNAEKISLTKENILVTNYGTVSAYSRQSSWVKEFMSGYALPRPCVLGDEVYFNDIFGKNFKISPVDRGGPVTVGGIPKWCNDFEAYYKNGIIYTSDGWPVYTYAERIRTEGKKQLFKRVEDNRTIYFLTEN